MRIIGDQSGQMSLDFLIGLGIFLMAFIFVLTFVPSMLVPFQSSSDDLTMTADRVSTELVDNILIANGSTPNVINQTITASFISELNTPASYDTVRKSIGLNGTRLYNINVTYGTIKNYGLSGGPAYPTGALNMGQSRRIVTNEIGDIGSIYVTVW